MPPKKGKKKGKGKKKAKSQEEPKASPPPLSESSKEYYLIQIKDLEARLTRYQRKCDQLQILNDDLEERYQQLFQDRKDIVEFLKKSLEERQEDIASLQDKLVGQQQVKEAEKEVFEDKIVNLQDDYQAVQDQMTAEITILKGKLDSLEDFRIQKDDLTNSFRLLKEAFEQQEKDHAEEIYDLERKAVVDRDRMKKEMLVHLNAVAEEFRNLSDQQTADTVKRNIRENVAINVQLLKMTETVKDLLQENDCLRKRNKNKKIQIDILEHSQDSFAKKNNNITKILKLLSVKSQDQRSRLEELESKDTQYEKVEDHSEDMRKENEAMKDEVKRLEEELNKTREMLRSATTENDELHAASGRLQDILSSTAYSLKEVLTEQPGEGAVDTAHKRQTMVERLLLVLNAAALLGKGPPPKEFFQQRSKALMAPLAAIPRRRKQDISIMDRYREFPHYKLGDLGLVPRPRRKLDRRAANLPSSANYMAHLPQILSKAPLISSVTPETPVNPKSDKLPPIG